jgi:3-hydroxymyristoyl/3-hydroxydecanoyl-(acyl carrier protein) dehydratase
MNEAWHSISYKEEPSDSEILAEAHAESGSPWFSGHFPDAPILPGIAILSMVTNAITHHESKKGRNIKITGIRRVRFRLPVRPDELLTISMSLSNHDGGLSYHFDVAVKEKTACTGIIVAGLLQKEREDHG